MPRSRHSTGGRRCLIVERHHWETGGRQQQLQIPLKVARQFFGPGRESIRIQVRVTEPNGRVVGTQTCSISRVYPNQTRRVNGLPLIGQLPHCFIFIQEADSESTYDFWWEARDMVIVAAAFPGWEQGRRSQHGRGRLAIIVPAPVPRPVTSIGQRARS